MSGGQKRPLDTSASKDGMPEEKRQRPALASVIVEALKADSLQKLCSSLEPLLRRVVGEEVERALAKLVPSKTGIRTSPKRIQGQDSRNLRLQFRNKLALPLFTGGKVEGEQGSAIHVVLQDASTGQVITIGPESSAKLDIVVLEGDFSNDDEEDWTEEDFENFVVREREGKRPLLTGDLSVTLKDGVGTLGELTFTDNSSWIRSRKFRLGVRVASGSCEGLRIREAKTEAFSVKDHRGELYKKHYPPALHDEVWRLDKIGKDGAFHKRLNKAGITTVEDFLRLVVMDPQKLRNILGSGMSNKMWEGTVEHAKTCVLSGKLYVYYADEKQSIGVIFNNIFQLMGLMAGGQYLSVDSLSDSEKVYVDKLVKVAYENWENVVEYDGEALVALPSSLRGIDTHTEEPSTHQVSHPHNVQTVSATNQKVSQDYSMRQPSKPYMSTGDADHLEHPAEQREPAPAAKYMAAQQSLGGGSSSYMMMGSDIQGSNVESSQVSIHNLSPQGLMHDSSMTGLSLVPTTPMSSYGTVNPYMQTAADWTRQIRGQSSNLDDLYSEEEIRAKSLELLETEDINLQMQQLMRLFNAGSDQGTTSMQTYDYFPMDGYPTSPEKKGVSNKGCVGWLKLKAALRWGIFVRKRAAARRRAQIEELDDE